ncbi:uncharacterized protein B0H18DRAFT_971080 [Fomitopsis serialis]|uniref:uncharacterized protein n=1 Tax=Fomitopsis serialis TaxID=139415 RepID=UPI0020083C31|nr:uncharacterized protein B0H18DRAFT_971080 [Neoantrodia serialis]KAH9937532.1 hypothetical protein B0H18DRAFT_971080 [Neoantrodia serialis]
MAVKSELHTIEISRRPRRTWAQTVNAVLAGVVFLFAGLMINGSQFIFLLPLKVLPFACADRMYYEGIRYSKGAFGRLLVLMSQWFAPTKLVGRFTEEQVKQLVERDGTGRVVGLRLPQRAVMIANHQIYADWWYAWSLTYYMGTCADVFIVLKESLKWLPIWAGVFRNDGLAQGMRFFNFIFLKRSWASDRLHLSSSLSWLGRRAETQDSPLTFILYPEGTLVSKDTKPLSKKFADKIGISSASVDRPHYSLRSLAPRIPSLQLIDLTMTYPGIPPFGYGQSYYTLRSMFVDRVPPPAVHMHIRCFDVAKDTSHKERVQEVDIPEKERETFELWLRDLWREKDKLISKYLESGSMADDRKAEVEIPLRLKRTREIFDAFCFFMPAAVFWAWWKFR